MNTFNDLASHHLGISEENVRDTLTPDDVEDWDSMTYLLFIAGLEKAYGISFTMEQITSAKCLGDIRRIVDARR
jgi:acyl carrier protein